MLPCGSMVLSGLLDFLERFDRGFRFFDAAQLLHELSHFQDGVFFGFAVGHQISFLRIAASGIFPFDRQGRLWKLNEVGRRELRPI